MNDIALPRETKEFIAVEVLVDGSPVTTGVQFCVAATDTRPSSWVAPVTIDGKIGVMIDHLDPGWYQVWAQVTDAPEVPVIACGLIRIT